VSNDKYTFESVPSTPGPGIPKSMGFSNGADISKMLNHKPSSSDLRGAGGRAHSGSVTSQPGNFTKHDYENVDPAIISSLESNPGYKRWVAQAGTLVADLLTCAGADQYV
jgi:ribose-phosphate pyrophosphokinase